MTTLRARRSVLAAAVAVASLLLPLAGTATAAGTAAAAPAIADAAPAADCSRAHTGRLPLSDMTDGQTYLGAEGGLYPGGVNQRPTAHTDAGADIARTQVKPRTPTGTIDATTGLIGMISIGMSNTSMEFSRFITNVSGDPALHPRLRMVDGAQGGQGAALWIDPDADTWRGLAIDLEAAGIAAPQVQVLWLKQQLNGDNLRQFGRFPASAEGLQDHLRTIVQIARQKYPNLRLAYLSSRGYGDYASADRGLGAYESGFAVKWLVEEQIAGDPALDHTGPDAVAPWLSWGPYLWADGLGPDRAVGGVPGRSDGLEWRCSDFNPDGVHPNTAGQQKVARALNTFFRTDATTRPWFLDA